MTKVITVTSIRPGAGKTTVAAILAEKLADMHTVCLIDNNQNNINIYTSTSTIENINLYICLSDKEICRRAIKESAAELKKNLYFFSGGNSLLTEEEIKIMKKQDIFEYIIIDSGADINIDQDDNNIIVANPNVIEYNAAAFERSADSNILIVINRHSENSEFKVKRDFKLYFSPEIINFTNGFELVLPEVNEKEVRKIIEVITGGKPEKKVKKKLRLFGGNYGIQGNRKLRV